MTTIIQKNGMVYTMVNNEKSDKIFYDKLNFIFDNLKNDKNDFETRNNLSKCYINYKYLGVEYNSEIMNLIQKK